MSEEKKPFIKEKIVKKSGAGKKFRRIVAIIAGAILFGIIAAIVVVVALPTAQKYLGKNEETKAQPVVIPRDDPDTITKYADKAEEIAEQKETVAAEEVEEIVQSAIENYDYSMDNLNSLWDNAAALCNKLDASVVTVKSVENKTDLFDNTVLSEGSFSGIAVAETDRDMMILTVIDAVQGDSVKVVWKNDDEQEAEVIKADKLTGLAVLKVSKAEMSELTATTAKVAELGNAYKVARGDMLIAIGSPKSVSHSTNYTWVSYISSEVTMIDGYCRIMFVDSQCDAKAGTWFTNSSGEVVGWCYKSDSKSQNTDYKGITAVAGVSDFKGLLERMLNGEDYAYLGIKASNLSSEISEDISEGIYVEEVVSESPAYYGGIQPGDIIYMIGDEPVNNLHTLRSTVETLTPGTTVSFNIYRESKEGYKEIIYSIDIDKRP